MKQFYFFFAFALMAIAASAQEPLYTMSTIASNVDSEGWEAYASSFAFQGTKVNVEVYDANYVIIKNWAGAEGCDLKVEYDPNIVVDSTNYGNIISVTNIINGKEVEPSMYTSGGYNYCDFQTGREDYGILCTTLNADATIYYSWLEVDKEKKTGYVMLTGYFMTSDYSDYNKSEYYYYVEWPQVEKPLHTMSTTVSNIESWGASSFAFQGTKVNVEVYDENYVIIKNWAGTEGCDLKVEIDPSIVVDSTNYGNIISITNIINGEEVEPVKYQSGGYNYCDFKTGREDYGILSTTLNEDGTIYYSWLEYDKETKMGYVLLTGYFMTSDYSDYNKSEYYYYVEWPSDEDEPVEPVNPFDGEATLLYSAVAKTGDAGGVWGASVFPVVENVKVDVYDKYIYIHALGGVEGYDLKVAYDKDENVTSAISITNGKDGERSETASYIYTGREDKYCLYAYYYGYSYAATYEDNSGYVILSSWIYNPDNTSDWSYYYLSWDKASENGIDSITTDINSNGAKFNLSGMRVNDDYEGIVIKNGKKVIQTGK